MLNRDAGEPDSKSTLRGGISTLRMHISRYVAARSQLRLLLIDTSAKKNTFNCTKLAVQLQGSLCTLERFLQVRANNCELCRLAFT